MPKARYWRIVVSPKVIPSEIEISGIRFYNHDILTTFSDAIIRLNFTPVSSNVNILLRQDIVENDALVLPLTKGNLNITFDMLVDKDINAFQIGFGSTDQKSLTKFILQYSIDGINYNNLYQITDGLKLKFNSPYQFSSLTAANTGYPSLVSPITKRISNPTSGMPSLLFDTNKRRISSATNSAFDTIYGGSTGCRFFIPLSGWMKPDKYYFETSTETVINKTFDASVYFGIGYKTTNEYQFDRINALLFSINSSWNGKVVNNIFDTTPSTSYGANNPPNFGISTNGKTGFQSSFLIDLINKKIELINSPFSVNLDFTYLKSFFNEIATSDSIFFFLTNNGQPNSIQIDHTFNFGQLPWKFEPPAGFDGRIGYRHEMEVDTSFEVNNYPELNSSITNPVVFTVDEPLDVMTKFNINNLAVAPNQNYYIKGKVSALNGSYIRKVVKLFTYPEMQILREMYTSTVDGAYEFLYLENRDYIIVSSDLKSEVYTSEMIGPLKPILMEF